ncbi:hypothetical protein, partial [Enterococcus faecium]|uniref:hypothetical protein n=1 Tax=Enterococcus faecium TaxID=1352 RepID=UPI001C6093B7
QKDSSQKTATMFKLILLVLALVAVAAAQYPYYGGYYGTGYYGAYASPYAYSALGYGLYGR